MYIKWFESKLIVLFQCQIPYKGYHDRNISARIFAVHPYPICYFKCFKWSYSKYLISPYFFIWWVNLRLNTKLHSGCIVLFPLPHITLSGYKTALSLNMLWYMKPITFSSYTQYLNKYGIDWIRKKKFKKRIKEIMYMVMICHVYSCLGWLCCSWWKM